MDTDEFDAYYEQMILWNISKREIVGAYRLGLADEICGRLGVRGLYTVTCFKYDSRLIDRIQPCIELGRSWVRVEYQRAFSSLLLLWRGICAFIIRHPHYTTLFGPVSISSDYLDTSRNMILRSLRLSNFEKDLARLVRRMLADGYAGGFVAEHFGHPDQEAAMRRSADFFRGIVSRC